MVIFQKLGQFLTFGTAPPKANLKLNIGSKLQINLSRQLLLILGVHRGGKIVFQAEFCSVSEKLADIMKNRKASHVMILCLRNVISNVVLGGRYLILWERRQLFAFDATRNFCLRNCNFQEALRAAGAVNACLCEFLAFLLPGCFSLYTKQSQNSALINKFVKRNIVLLPQP